MLKLGAGEIQLKMSPDLELVKCTTFDLWWTGMNYKVKR